ncbi:MAG: hypothetical protein GXZ11_00685 [Tissierellia bacterium]|nr:hypothetical protein [Tissierellia bacterium]
MVDIIKFNSMETTSNNEDEAKNNLIQITDDLLLDARVNIDNLNTISMPIAKLSTLGSGASSLLPSLRSITTTTSINMQGLFKVANLDSGDVLKKAKDNNYWGALKNANGTSKMAKFAPADSVAVTTKAVGAINPSMVMMSVALFSIEEQLNNIQETQKKFLQFIEFEKESLVEADVEQLISIITKYKHNWNNDKFISSNHKMVSDIQRTARAHILSYQKEIDAILDENKGLLAQTHVKTQFNDLLKNFKYYRLSLFTFSLSSLLEIMLSGNFQEDYISEIKQEIEKFAVTYRMIFEKSSFYLENINNSSIEIKVLKGVGNTSNFIGQALGSMPVIKKGSSDEFFHDVGDGIKKKVHESEQNVIKSFAEISDPATRLFTEKMTDMIQIYNHTSDIYFDNEKIYLVQEG